MTDKTAFPAVILAAGKSERMGFPKILLSREKEWLLESMIRNLHATGWHRVAIVLSDKALCRLISDRLPQVEIIFNEEPDKGMINSIRLSIDWAGENVAGLL